jgi:hypothetical protein
MPVNIPKSITLTVGANESQLEFTRRALMEAAQLIGLPLLEQVYFADFFYPLCGEKSANYRINWWKQSDPSPLDNDLTMHDTEWKQLCNKTFTLAITPETRDELQRRYDYFLARGGKLFSPGSPFLLHTAVDEMTYVSPCTAQQLLNSKFKSAIECRADALRRLIDEIGARADLYPSNSEKALKILGTAWTGAKFGVKGGAVVGTVVGGVLAPVGGAVGGAVGAAGGAAVGVYLAESREYDVEARPVKNFLQRTVECAKFAKLETQTKSQPSQASMGAGIQQIFMVTKQFGIFALYPFTLKRGPTLLGDYVIEEHGANPTDPIKTSFGK